MTEHQETTHQAARRMGYIAWALALIWAVWGIWLFLAHEERSAKQSPFVSVFYMMYFLGGVAVPSVSERAGGVLLLIQGCLECVFMIFAVATGITFFNPGWMIFFPPILVPAIFPVIAGILFLRISQKSRTSGSPQNSA